MSIRYDGSSIDVLEGLEAVRVRPGMYIGSTGTRGLHHLLWEILDNAVDESLAGYCTDIWVTINPDQSITVEDNGRGMPVDIHPKMKIPTVRVIYTILHAGGKFKEGAYQTAGGLHGVGASVVNALSKHLKAEVFRNGKIYVDVYENGGKPITKLTKTGNLPTVGKTEKTGSRITFLPDDTIFETTKWDIEMIENRLKEVSYLNKGLKIHFFYQEKKKQKEKVFFSEDGICGFLKEMNQDKNNLTDLVYFSGESKETGLTAEIALQISDEEGEHVMGYCNNIATTEGGTHLTGFRSGLTRLINTYISKEFNLKETPDGKDIRRGLTAIISLKHHNPQYEGQTKTKLSNSDAKSAMEEIVIQAGTLYFDRHLSDLKAIVDNAIQAYKRRQKETSKKVNIAKDTFSISHKLADCFSKKREECEIFLVEGDSAGGTSKIARNRKTQAVLPLRGKIFASTSLTCLPQGLFHWNS